MSINKLLTTEIHYVVTNMRLLREATPDEMTYVVKAHRCESLDDEKLISDKQVHYICPHLHHLHVTWTWAGYLCPHCSDSMKVEFIGGDGDYFDWRLH